MFTDQEMQSLRAAGRIAATVLEEMCQHAQVGMSTYDLDQFGKQRIQHYGAESACFQFRNRHLVFPSHTCLSVNEEVVHGIGTLERCLKEGDNLAIDVSVRYQGFIGDNARTIILGTSEPEMERLLEVTEKALMIGISKARHGQRVGEISNAVQTFVEKHGFGVVRDFVGHGVGRTMHEPPQIPNFGSRRSGERMSAGMVLAIEPMVTMGSPKVEIAADGWTALTRDRLPAAHFEKTVLVTRGEAEILSEPDLIFSEKR